MLSGTNSAQNLRRFDSEADLEAYVKGDDYDDPANFKEKVAFAIVLNTVDLATDTFDYTIRTNYTFPWELRFGTVACLGNAYSCNLPQSAPSTGTASYFQMPSTTTFDDQISRPQVSSYYYGYMYTGFLSLQKVTDEYFMSYAASPSTISALVSSGTPIVETFASMGVFPTEPYEANNFQQTISSLLPIFFMLAFLYPFSRFIRGLVLEKEQKIKEGMKIMGLSDVVYGLSWFITLGTQCLLSSLGILYATRSSVFEFSSDLSIFLYFFCFSMSVVMFSFMLATFFSRSKVRPYTIHYTLSDSQFVYHPTNYSSLRLSLRFSQTAAIMGTLGFFATYFPVYAVEDPSISTATKLLASLLSPTAFALGAGVLGNLEAGAIGATPESFFTMYDNFSFFYTIFMLCFDAVLYGLLAAYFDKVLPSEVSASES